MQGRGDQVLPSAMTSHNVFLYVARRSVNDVCRKEPTTRGRRGEGSFDVPARRAYGGGFSRTTVDDADLEYFCLRELQGLLLLLLQRNVFPESQGQLLHLRSSHTYGN